MCSSKKSLAFCLFESNKNMSIVSDAYRKVDKNKKSELNQIEIIFKRKPKLMTSIDDKTTFGDLKLALLISYYKKRLSKSTDVESRYKKLEKNYEAVKRIAREDYVICESMNDVEKMIDDTQTVKSSLERIRRESNFLKDLKVTHTMRLKRSIARLTQETPEANDPQQVPMLDEFFLDEKVVPVEEPIYENIKPYDIDNQLKCFDKYIEQRKNYIKLLEEYLALSDSLEADLLQSYDSTSSDTGFGSTDEASPTSSTSSLNKFDKWCLQRNVSESSKMYFQKISNFETYV